MHHKTGKITFDNPCYTVKEGTVKGVLDQNQSTDGLIFICHHGNRRNVFQHLQRAHNVYGVSTTKTNLKTKTKSSLLCVCIPTISFELIKIYYLWECFHGSFFFNDLLCHYKLREFHLSW